VLRWNAFPEKSAARGCSKACVPVAALFENLEDGATVDDFLEWFPGVAREQVEAVLEHAGQSLAVA
jgi:uncharacterized protein (DUF433 family)